MAETLHLAPPPTRKPRRALKRFLGLSALLSAALCGLGFWLFAGRMVLPRGILDGTLLPVVSPMTARAVEVLASEGEMVRAGQTLIRLDSAAYRQQETWARPLAARSAARPPGMERTADRAASAQAAEEYITRRLALARHEEESARRLVEEKAMEHARTELRMRELDARDAARQDRENARQTETAARRGKDEAKAAFETASRARAAIEGELARARREMEAARHSSAGEPAPVSAGSAAAMEDPTVIRAPDDGRVVGSVAPGRMLPRGETVLRLAPAKNAELWVVLAVDENRAAALEPGQFCLVRPMDMPDTALPGEVASLSAASPSSPGTGKFNVRVRLSDVPAALAAQLPGKPALVTVWRRAVPGMRRLMPLLARLS